MEQKEQMEEKYIKRRFKILARFADAGFRGLTPFITVCTSLDDSIDTNKVSRFYRMPFQDDTFYNRLDEILQILKYE